MLRVARGSLRARLRQPLATASGTGTALHPFKLCQAPPPCASIARLATSGAAETASDISSAKKAAKDRRFARKAAAIAPCDIDSKTARRAASAVRDILRQQAADDAVPLHQLLRVLVGYEGYVVPTREAVTPEQRLPGGKADLLTFSSDDGKPILVACTDEEALGDAGEVAPSPDACLRMSGSELLFHWHKSQEEPTVTSISGLVINPMGPVVAAVNKQLLPPMLGLGLSLRVEKALDSLVRWDVSEKERGRDGLSALNPERLPPREALEVIASFPFTVLLNESAGGEYRIHSTPDGTTIMITATDLAAHSKQLLDQNVDDGTWHITHYPLAAVLAATAAEDGTGVQLVFGWAGKDAPKHSEVRQLTWRRSSELLALFECAGVALRGAE